MEYKMQHFETNVIHAGKRLKWHELLIQRRPPEPQRVLALESASYAAGTRWALPACSSFSPSPRHVLRETQIKGDTA